MSSHRQIFKSTALIGGSQVINMGIGILRNKAMALLLGPAGVGVAGLYLSITNLVGSVAGLGLNASGVRQIAEAAGTNDEERIARTVITLRRVSRFSGLLGMGITLGLASVFSRSTFGDDKHVGGIALISLVLLCGDISSGQLALLQGLRRLRELAASQIVGAVFGALVSIPLVWWLRQGGIVPYLVVNGAFGILFSWWFARKVSVRRVVVTWKETLVEARGLLALGTAFIVAALIAKGTGYVAQIMVQRELGLAAVGIYSATWTLSTYYVSLVLNAMGTDYMPRLTAVSNDHPVMNRLICEQAEMGVLIALPGVLATLTLAPWVMKAFYSGDFVAGANVVRWQILGVFLRVVSWPLGYVLIAKGKSVLYSLSELMFGVVLVVAMVFCVKAWGLDGVGIAFALAYVVYTLVLMEVGRRLIGFRWSAAVAKILIPSFFALGLVFCCTQFLSQMWSLGIGLAVTVLGAIICLSTLQRLLNVNLWQIVRRKFQPDLKAESL